jgi:hypothetical protein
MPAAHAAFRQVVERVRPRLAHEFPTAQGPLLATLGRYHQATLAGDLVVVSDLVWQTAPSVELIRAFAPAPGQEKVRPIEGFEMQAEHAGFAIAERVVVDPALWHPAYADDAAKRAALAGDGRGAARVCVWVLRREA